MTRVTHAERTSGGRDGREVVLIRAPPRLKHRAEGIRDAVKFIGYEAMVEIDGRARDIHIVVDGMVLYDDSYALSLLLERRRGERRVR